MSRLQVESLPENAFSGTFEAWRRGVESLRQELGLDEAEVLLEPGSLSAPNVVVLIAHGNALQCLSLADAFHSFPGRIDMLLRDKMGPAAKKVKALAEKG